MISLALEDETISFPIEEEISISDHNNNYTKLLTDLANVDVIIDYEDNALIMLSSLPYEGYETFVLILINRRTSLSYSEVTTALVNLGLRRKNKVSLNSISVEVLTVKGRSTSQRRGNRGRSKSM